MWRRSSVLASEPSPWPTYSRRRVSLSTFCSLRCNRKQKRKGSEFWNLCRNLKEKKPRFLKDKVVKLRIIYIPIDSVDIFLKVDFITVLRNRTLGIADNVSLREIGVL